MEQIERQMQERELKAQKEHKLREQVLRQQKKELKEKERWICEEQEHLRAEQEHQTRLKEEQERLELERRETERCEKERKIRLQAEENHKERERRLSKEEEERKKREQKCLAIVSGIGAFETYLIGKPFVLQTDHQALQWLQRSKDRNTRLLRWSLMLQPYTFTIQHCQQLQNGNADALSRLPVDSPCFALKKGEGMGNVADQGCKT